MVIEEAMRKLTNSISILWYEEQDFLCRLLVLNECIDVFEDLVDLQVRKWMLRPASSSQSSHVILDSSERYSVVVVQMHGLGQRAMSTVEVAILQLASSIEEDLAQWNTIVAESSVIR